jgi:hypothetical protein
MRTAHSLLRLVSILLDLAQDAMQFLLLGTRSSYRSGPERKVPGRHGMSYTEEDWVDDEATSRRGPDE